MYRRQFLKYSSAVLVAGQSLVSSSQTVAAAQEQSTQTEPAIPSYLAGYAKQFEEDPNAAAVQWFQDAKFGLFLHYGLYSLLERGEWVQLKEKIHVAEYAKLKDKFTAENFDANKICDLAVAAGCKYVNITTRHHDSFCLFKTQQTDFQSLNSPAKRDLVGELVEACNQRGLGIFFYYSHGRDWRHPHAPNNWGWGGSARPKYKEDEPFYVQGEKHDLQKYVDFMSAQIEELLTQYGPVAGIWLDGHATPMSRKKKMHLWKLPELYKQIRDTQKQTLISYKGGVTGTEDFFAPERKWNKASEQPVELCDTLQPHSWGCNKSDNGKHKKADQVMQMLERAKKLNANLLLNSGPLPDGSIPKEDIATLIEVGKRLRV